VAISPYVIDYQGHFRLPAPPEEVWSAISRVDNLQRLWSWLREFRVEGPMLEPGSVLRGVVAPPLPYRMGVEVDLTDCLPYRRIDAIVHGDLEGRARLVLDPDGPDTRAEAAWTIEMMQPPMRLAARVAAPVLRWGHDRVVEATVIGFCRHLRRSQITPG
jgi:carbon monoxide dehydrogenase subunit G